MCDCTEHNSSGLPLLRDKVRIKECRDCSCVRLNAMLPNTTTGTWNNVCLFNGNQQGCHILLSMLELGDCELQPTILRFQDGIFLWEPFLVTGIIMVFGFGVLYCQRFGFQVFPAGFDQNSVHEILKIARPSATPSKKTTVASWEEFAILDV